MRCVTRREYTSSSLVPRSTSSTTVTAAATSETSSAAKNPSTLKVWSERSAAALTIQASSTRTRRNPTASMYGSRNAAISGGTTALRMAISAAAMSAPKNPSILTPGTRIAAMYSARALVTHWSSSRRARILGLPGDHCGVAPYALASTSATSTPFSPQRSGPV